MLPGNQSLLAILQQKEGPGDERMDMSSQYLSLLAAKLALDIFMAVFGRPSLIHSLMGMNFLSLCLADFLLAAALTITKFLCPLDGYHGEESSMAFLLSHASAIYATLPIPMLVLGGMDYIITIKHSLTSFPLKHQYQCWGHVGRLCAVTAIWVTAALHSAWHTNSSVLKVEQGSDLLEQTLVCEVQVSCQVTIFCLVLLVGIALALVPHLPRIPSWMYHKTCVDPAQTHKSTVSYVEAGGSHDPVLAVPPPLYAGCALELALHWGLYLLVHTGAEMFQMGIPAYASVNTLWLCCANSLLVSAIYWATGGGAEWDNSCRRLDGVCNWTARSYTCHTSKGYKANELPWELQTPTQRKLQPPLLK